MYTIPQQKLMIKPWDWLAGFIPQSDSSLRLFIPKSNLYWTSSARNALFLLLRSLQQKSENKLTIAIPAFTCQVVKEAAQNADCKIIYYDSSVTCSKEDIESVIIQKPDVLLLCYNFGYLPSNIQQISNLCKQNNITVIEDCAQALGASQNNKLAGAIGDYAIYSFGISKNIGFTGGLIASDNQLKLPSQKKMPLVNLTKSIIQSIIGPIIVSNLLFPLTQKLLNKQVSNIKNYPAKQYTLPKFAQNVINYKANCYASVINKRRKNYTVLTGNQSTDACLYLPIIKEKSTEIKTKAAKKEIELDNMKSFKFLAPENQKSKFPKARFAAKNHLAFALLRSKKEIEKIKQVIQ
ncbi:hypothetical protein HOA92_02115 [archaeon]|nr:hypothetical protein [archaeon]MBT6761809.1 hypothetical protein [archaeon]